MRPKPFSTVGFRPITAKALSFRRRRFPIMREATKPSRPFPLFGFTAGGRSQKRFAEDQFGERAPAFVPTLNGSLSQYTPLHSLDSLSLHKMGGESWAKGRFTWLTQSLSVGSRAARSPATPRADNIRYRPNGNPPGSRAIPSIWRVACHVVKYCRVPCNNLLQLALTNV